MCYVHLREDQISKYGKELSADEWLKIAEEVKQAGTTWLCITGGEPLLHPEFYKIWKALCQMGFFLTLQTNASLITEEIIKLFEQYRPRQVKITLYGTDDEVYESVCGIKNGFTNVNDGIHTLMSMKIPVTLVSTIIEQNEKDVQKMAFYAYLHQLPWVSTASVEGSKRHNGIDVSSIQVTDKLEQSWKNSVKECFDEVKFYKKKQKPCTYCRDYRIGYWILWDGSMRFCSFMNEPDISVRDITFIKAWQQLLDYEEMLNWPEKCQLCNAFSVCAKCAATVTNLKHKDYFCKIMQLEYKKIIEKEKK